jgi:hypothetical protein
MKYRMLVSVLTCAALLVGCSEQNAPVEPDSLALTSPSAAVTDNYREPFVFWGISCEEPVEVVRLEGVDHWVIQYNETSSGKRVDGIHSNYTATAVGQTTGNIWKLNGGQLHFRVNWDDVDGFPYVLSYLEQQILVSQGRLPNMMGKWRYHVTLSANGEVTVEREVGEFVCK